MASIFPRGIYYESYYLINFLTGLAGLFGLKKVIKYFFGTSVSKIFFVISIFSPLFFGHLSINPKDTIIATANFWIFYYIIKYLKNSSNQIREKISIKIGLFIGLGAGVRIIFLGTLIPLILFMIFEIFFFKKIFKKLDIKIFLKHIIYVILISYILIIFCWPNVHSNIFLSPFIIFFQSLTDISQGVQSSFFSGIFYETVNTPWYYILLNIFFKVPVIYLFCFFLTFFSLSKIKKDYKNDNFFYFIGVSLFILILPIVISILLNLKIHDGLRYFIYLIPLLNFIPAIYISHLYKEFSLRRKIMFPVILSPFLVVFLMKFLLITPYQYSYLNLFNDFFLKKDSFENDYWGTSSKELIKKFSKKIHNKKSFNIAICGLNHINVKYYLKRYGVNNYNFIDMDKKFDFAILVNRAISNKKSNLSETCYSRFKDKKVFVVVNKSFIDLSKIVEY